MNRTKLVEEVDSIVCNALLNDDTIEITSGQGLDDIRQVIEDAVENYGDELPGVCYYREAFDVVISNEFPEPSEGVEGCENALQALLREANDVLAQAYYEEVGSIILEYAEGFAEVAELILEKSGRDDINLQIDNGTIYGWEAHNYETDTGVCVWSDEPGHYYANLLEGELWAIEGTTNGITVGACWTPEKETEAA